MNTRRRRTKSGSKDENKENFQSGYGVPLIDSGKTFTESQNFNPVSLDTIDMSCRDRTGEFLSAVKSLQSSQLNGHAGRHGNQNGRKVQPSQFTMASRKIGRDINNTFNKLEKLAILAKRKSLFNDKPKEIQELTYIIKQDINHLNQQIGDLQQFVNRTDSASSKNVQAHSHTVVMSLQSKLAHMSKDFKHVLEVRTENMKHQKNRRDQFSQGAVAETLPSTQIASNSLLHRNVGGGNNDSVSLDMEPLMASNTQAQLYEENDEYVQSRATAMESIEQTIVELGGIFQQLAHLVSEQEEQIKRIDANVEDTETNVEAAHGELLKYFQNISSNRWLIIKIFFTLIIFFIVFVVFMA